MLRIASDSEPFKTSQMYHMYHISILLYTVSFMCFLPFELFSFWLFIITICIPNKMLCDSTISFPLTYSEWNVETDNNGKTWYTNMFRNY